MLKKTISYEDFDGVKITEDFYFNLTKSEMVEMELQHKDGLGDAIQRIIAANDTKALLVEFKKLILGSFGVKSEDGKRFIKSKESIDDFTSSAAYDALFMELATNDTAAADFIKGIIPRDMLSAAEEAQAKLQAPTPLAPPQV